MAEASSASGDSTTTMEEEVAALEMKFKNRFTEEDQEYQKMVSTPASSPPFVYPWGARPRQQRGNYRDQNDRRDQRRDQWRSRDGRWGNSSSSNPHRDREDRRSYDRSNDRGYYGDRKNY